MSAPPPEPPPLADAVERVFAIARSGDVVFLQAQQPMSEEMMRRIREVLKARIEPLGVTCLVLPVEIRVASMDKPK